MIKNFLKHILLDVASENKKTYCLKRSLYVLFFVASLFLSNDRTHAAGGETDFKTFLKAAQKEIVRQQGIIEQDPLDYQSYFELGLAYQTLGRHKEEIQAYQEALSLNPKSALTHFNLSIAYDHLKDGRKAIHHMERAQYLYVLKRNHRKIRATQRHLKRYFLSYPDLSGEKILGR